MSEPELRLSLREVADTIGVPVAEWPGRCHEIAGLCLAAGVVQGTLRYGLWLGPIAKNAPKFAGRGATHHGWVEVEPDDPLLHDVIPCAGCGHIRDEHARNFLAECTVEDCGCPCYEPAESGPLVFDPTRWVFEGVPPYLYYQRDGRGYYDAAGDMFRQANMRPCPSDRSGRKLGLKLPAPTAAHLLILALTHGGVPLDMKSLSAAQLHWLATLPLALLRDHAGPLYKALDQKNRGQLVPLDNREHALGDGFYGRRTALVRRVQRRAGRRR